MSQTFRRSPIFTTDVQTQFAWYWDEAGEKVAWQFESAVERTLLTIARQPGLGRERHFKRPELQGLRSFRIESPFTKLLLFYRVDGRSIEAWRLMHGACDLPRRLLEPPGSGNK